MGGRAPLPAVAPQLEEVDVVDAVLEQEVVEAGNPLSVGCPPAATRRRRRSGSLQRLGHGQQRRQMSRIPRRQTGTISRHVRLKRMRRRCQRRAAQHCRVCGGNRLWQVVRLVHNHHRAAQSNAQRLAAAQARCARQTRGMRMAMAGERVRKQRTASLAGAAPHRATARCAPLAEPPARRSRGMRRRCAPPV